MTISTSASSVTAAGNGSTTSFNFSFIAGQASNIVVTFTDATSNETVLVQGSQYTLTLNAPAVGQIWGVGGTVTYPLSGAPLASGTYLTISRVVPFTQLTSISNQGDFYPQAVEKAIDTLEMQIQQVEGQADRAIVVNPADVNAPLPLPIAAVRAGQYLAFDSQGNPIAATPAGAGIPISTAMQPVVEAPTTQAAVAFLRYLASISGAVPRLLVAKLGDIVSVKDFGATGDGTTDDSAAFQAAITAAGNASKCLFVPNGTYLCNSALTHTGSLHIQGESVIGAVVLFPANAGFAFTIPDQFHSLHLRDLTILGGAIGSGNPAITIASGQTTIADPANSQLSDLTNININGSDGIGNTNYFPIAIDVTGPSNINFVNVSAVGTNSQQGVGLQVTGTSTLPPNVYNLTGCTFVFLNVGVTYGNYVQGITLSQCNLTGCNFGINSPVSESVLVQLAVNNSQFNCFNAGINLNTIVPYTLITGNLFFMRGVTGAPNPTVGVNLVQSGLYSIVGNAFNGYGATTEVNGVVVGPASAVPPGIITGNIFYGMFVGVDLQTGSTGANVQSNVYLDCGTAVVNNGSGNTVGGGSS